MGNIIHIFYRNLPPLLIDSQTAVEYDCYTDYDI